MISINIPSDYEIKLEQIAQNENITVSEVVEKAIQVYFSHYFEQTTPYTLGKDLFGKYGSGNGNLSSDYKKRIKEKLREKYSC